MKMKYYNYIKKRLDELNLDINKPYLLAFSGGPDSVYLLLNLLEYGFKHIICAYVNYNDSPFIDKEQEAIYHYVNKYNLELCRLDIPFESIKDNFEAEARDIRYDFFKKLARERHIDSIFVAHQEDDSLETYLMQLSRHNLVINYGLSIKSKQKDLYILRPMLDISKWDLTKDLDDNNLPYYYDVTNDNLEHERNYLRFVKIPNMNKKRLLEEMKEKNESLLNEYNYIDKLIETKKVNLESYLELEESTRRRLIYKYLQKYFKLLDNDKTVSLLNLIYNYLLSPKTDKEYLNYDLFLFKSNEYFFISNDTYVEDYEYELKEPKVYDFKEVSIDATKLDKLHITLEDFPLYVRKVKQGDTFVSNIKTKDVINFLKKNKVPSYLRNNYPVILNNKKEPIYSPFFKNLDKKDELLKIKFEY